MNVHLLVAENIVFGQATVELLWWLCGLRKYITSFHTKPNYRLQMNYSQGQHFTHYSEIKKKNPSCQREGHTGNFLIFLHFNPGLIFENLPDTTLLKLRSYYTIFSDLVKGVHEF